MNAFDMVYILIEIMVRELMFRSRDCYAIRGDFYSICPGKHVSDDVCPFHFYYLSYTHVFRFLNIVVSHPQIMAYVIERLWWVQKNEKAQTVWYLPPHFVV